MNSTPAHAHGTAIVIGASGQDGYFLTERLLAENRNVHATARRTERLSPLALAGHEEKGGTRRLHVHTIDLCQPQPLFDLIARTQPEEIYNLAGASSVSRSFADPLQTWRTNADFVAALLECVRLQSPHTRFYQASSTDMFGGEAGATVLHNEDSRLSPESPYASAKAAAHMLCRSYREAYNLRIACGILSNHESHRRPVPFLSRKIVDHVSALRRLPPTEVYNQAPLRMGNLKIRRDWGFAPDYVEGMMRVMRQISVRSARSEVAHAPADEGVNYRDYVLGTGQTHAVWQLVDAAFKLAGFTLEWQLDGDQPVHWLARFERSAAQAVVVDAATLRSADPLVIQVDPSRVREELGWMPRQGLELFLKDMLGDDCVRAAF